MFGQVNWAGPLPGSRPAWYLTYEYLGRDQTCDLHELQVAPLTVPLFPEGRSGAGTPRPGPAPAALLTVTSRSPSTSAPTLERMIDMRPQADRLVVAKLTGKPGHHAKWRPLTAAGKAAAVAALREVAGGRAGLLADVALGFCERWRPDTPGSGHAVLFALVSGL